MKKQTRLLWIDGVKYIACIGVFLSHFCSAFIGENESVQMLSPIIVKIVSIFSMFLDGAFWVRLFCILSGALVAQKIISQKTELIECIFMRYLRFVIPFFSAGCIFYIIEYTVGYHAVECGKVLNLAWIGTHNQVPVRFSDVLKMAFSFKYTIDASLWTILPIFAGSIIIYIINYVLFKIKIPEKYWGGIYITLFLLSIIKYDINSLCVSCCILGAGMIRIWDYIKFPHQLADVFCIVVIVMVTFGHPYLLEVMSQSVDVPVRIGLDGYGYIFYAIILLLCIKNSNILKLFFEKWLSQNANLSFPIYVLHMPLIMSFSSLICLFLYEKVSYSINFIINIIISMLLVRGSSYCYEKYIDKYQNRLINKIKKSLNKLNNSKK